MPNEIWYLALLIPIAGIALVVPAVRRWDRVAPSDEVTPTRAGTRPGAPPKAATTPPKARPSAPTKPGVKIRPPVPVEPEPAPVAEAPPAAPVEAEAPSVATPPKAPAVPAPPVAPPVPEVPEEVLEKPEPTAGRLTRLRARLSKSQNMFGRGLLALLSRDKLDDETWDEIEETLISADVGVEATRQIVERLREQARVRGTASAADLRDMLASELVEALDPGADRTL
jgi:fused signal recognition particle receptor